MNKCWLRCVKCSRKSDFQLIGKCAACGGTLIVEYDLVKGNFDIYPGEFISSGDRFAMEIS